MEVGALGKVLLVSPHLDDGVFSCGEFLAAHPNTRVLTVFAGLPADDRLTEWDAACGFSDAREAMTARLAEDRAALGILGAEPRWLDFTDSQYRGAQPLDGIAAALEGAAREHDADTIIIPFGLFHSDHERVHAAALRLFRDDSTRTWFAYEDALYRAIPGLLQRRLRRLDETRIRATPAALHTERSPKQRAVVCYASQLRGLATPGRPGPHDILAPERYWRLALH